MKGVGFQGVVGCVFYLYDVSGVTMQSTGQWAIIGLVNQISHFVRNNNIHRDNFDQRENPGMAAFVCERCRVDQKGDIW